MNDFDAKDRPDAAELLAGHDDLLEVWDELEALPLAASGGAPGTDAAWQEISARLGLGDAAASSPGSARTREAKASAARPSGRRRIAAAAAAVVLLTAAVGGWYAVPQIVGAAPGAPATVQLPDGSTVRLNGGTRLTHSRGFSRLPGLARGSRTVALEGEAFFDVVSDGRPFVVETPLARVRVLGTRFSVRATDPALEGISVAVTEGRVEVVSGEDRAGAGSEARVRLGVGEAATVTAAGDLRRVEGASDHLVAWTEGAFVAVDRPLAAALAHAARTFGVEISLHAPRVEQRPVTFYYSADVGVERIVTDLATLNGLEYTQSAPGRWELRERR